MNRLDVNRRDWLPAQRTLALFALLLLITLAGACWLVLRQVPGWSLLGLSLLGAALAATLCLPVLWLQVSRLSAQSAGMEQPRAEMLIEQAADGIVTLNARGQILSLNPAAEQFFGYCASEVLNEPITHLIADPPRSGRQSVFLDSLPIGSILGLAAGAREVIGKRKNGETVSLELTGRSIPAGDDTISVAFIRDISKRKKAQRYLTAHYAATCILSEARTLDEALPRILQAVCEALGWDAGSYWGVAGGELSCTWLYQIGQDAQASSPDRRVSCKSGEGLVGEVWATGKPSWGADLQEKKECPCLALNIPLHLRGAVAFPVLLGQDVFGVVSFFSTGRLKRDDQLHDILGELGKQLGQFIVRKRDEEQLRKTTETIQALVRAAPVAINLLDMQGKVQLWNPAAERILGWSAEEILDRPLPALEDAGHHEASDRLSAALQGQSCNGLPTHCRRKNGTPVEVSLSAAPLRDPTGTIFGVMAILMDLTDQKHLEDQLRQSQKMEAIGQLAGGVAHDFNNLLTIITGYSELLLGTMAGDEPTFEFLSQIKKAGDRAASLTRQLLAFGRKQFLQIMVVDLNTVVGDLGKMLRRLIGEDIELVIQPDPLLDRIKADPSQIEQVILNLATNARDAMPDGGNLTIKTANVELAASGPWEPLGIPPGPYVLLSVQDTGSGMDEATRSRVFEPFFTTKEVGKGTGLGLAMVYGIVKQFRGHIEVDSEPGKGTTFRIYLPRLEEAHEIRGEKELSSERPKGTETVLLVEDEDSVRRLLGEMLRSSGYTVLEARSGEDALSVLEKHPTSVDLLLTDVIMPRMNGRQLAERVSAGRPDLKVLYMSGYTEKVMDNCRLGPGMAFLAKPITQGSLTRKVRELLDGPAKV